MSQDTKNLLRQIIVVVAAFATILVGILANALPINDVTTGEITARFDVLFVPATYVFSIWWLIYIGLAAYAVYQVQPSLRHDTQLRRLDFPFVVSSAANISWLLLWHYEQYVASLVVMAVLLGSLVRIYLLLRPSAESEYASSYVERSPARRLAVDTVFSVYLGWITVASISNLDSVLDHIDWNGWGLSPESWFMIGVIAVLVIAGTVAWRRADVAYLLTLVWAFFGLGVRHADDPTLATIAWSGTAVLAAFVVLSAMRTSRDQPEVAVHC